MLAKRVQTVEKAEYFGVGRLEACTSGDSGTLEGTTVNKRNTLPQFDARRPISDLEYIYDALKQSCMIGEFEPGQKITLHQLSEAFGTSQMPIREATNRLVAAKAMEAPPRRSLCIPRATLESLDSLLPLRLLLEGEAASLAALKPDPELADQMEQIDFEMVTLARTDDLKSYLRKNQEFHFVLYAASGNANMIDMIELLWMRYGPLMNIVRSGVLSSSGYAHHAAAIKAVREGNAEAAKHAIQSDLTDAASPIRKRILASSASN
ncbi:MAG: hypothetical protein VR71_11670 [Roseovarius sp. BRH_c41]|uniref:GntR family transcriptional regulator n=1 Tax=Roseovarius sp. BRH_c41 TaxID=1629709 RepID=UPI0005F0D9C5|nr:GntR family transcriptional regulator [Roseovarius sp. BRH_c41]KJS43115.1 MAG: hypothetical protein VR71_11670 [Roseovarius sp. BRH_c41]